MSPSGVSSGKVTVNVTVTSSIVTSTISFHAAISVIFAVINVSKSNLSPSNCHSIKSYPNLVGSDGSSTFEPSSTTTDATSLPPLLSNVTVYSFVPHATSKNAVNSIKVNPKNFLIS